MSRPHSRLFQLSVSRQLAAAGEVNSSHGARCKHDTVKDDVNAHTYSAVTWSTWCVDLNYCLLGNTKL